MHQSFRHVERRPPQPLTAIDAIYTRRSVRAYRPDRLDPETIRGLLDAAVQAPTAMHEERWAFVVIQDPATLRRLSDRAKAGLAADAAKRQPLPHPDSPETAGTFAARLEEPDSNLFYDAGALVLICATATGSFVEADCWLAAGTFMLAACALGLGTCCIGSAIGVMNQPDTRAELGLDARVHVVVPIIVGIPREDPPPTARRAPQILSWK